MAAQPQPMPQQSSPDGGGQQQAQGDPMQEWRTWAQAGMELAKKYPESTEGMSMILKEIQKIMVRVAGNPQRTPAAQAPPSGG